MSTEKIKEILKQIKGEYFDIEDNLISDGYINSFDLISLIDKIETNFGIKILLGELRPEDFDSVASISELIDGYTHN